MKNNLFFILVAILALFAGCKPSREKSLKQISDMETRLSKSTAMTFDKAKADSLLDLYNNFIQRFPKDSLSPKYLFRSAQLSMTMGNGPKSLELFDRFMATYPESPKASVCMFFKAYVYENILQNLEKAKETYLAFAEKYPNSEFARNAWIAIQNLGKSPEQMVREFETRHKADSARRADSLLAARKKHKK
jgi:outer membrane protein assembly factor BamD (BamD/ComL family)